MKSAQQLARAFGVGLDDLYADDPVNALEAALRAFYDAPVRNVFMSTDYRQRDAERRDKKQSSEKRAPTGAEENGLTKPLR